MESIAKRILNYPELKDIYTENQMNKQSMQDQACDYSAETLKTIFGLIDLTTLDVTDTVEKVERLCQKVNNLENNYPGMQNVAAICVYPALVATVRKALSISGVQIASVAGGFPASQTPIELKIKEAEIAVGLGATEIDIVMSVGKFIENKYQEVFEEIVSIKKSIGDAHLKVILETGALLHEQIYTASLLAMEAGADFIKTSTGKFSPAATPEAVEIMCLAINEFHCNNSKEIGIKPAGGISTTDDAIIYYSLVKKILGNEWLDKKLFRIGASRLAGNLLQEISKIEGKPFSGF